MKTIALDIGGTSIKAGEIVDGVLHSHSEFDTDAKQGGEFVIHRAMNLISQYSNFDRIGISTAGQVDSEQGSIRFANENIPGYTGMRIKDIMTEKFQVPVAVENDVNSAALGEAHYGAGKGIDDFLCLRGCYERYASTGALVRKAMEFDSALSSGRKIFEQMDHPKVQAIVDDWIQEILYGLTSLIHIFNPSCVILGGGIMNESYIIQKLQASVYNNIMPSYSNVVLKQAKLGKQAGLLGISYLATQCK